VFPIVFPGGRGSSGRQGPLSEAETGTVRPTGHLQVKGGAARRRYFALWRDADGRHQVLLGPAHVKDSGRRTPRGAIIWRAGDGPLPSPDHLTPADAAAALRELLAAAPSAPRPPGINRAERSHSARRALNGCATSSTSAGARRRRSATTAARYVRGCYRDSARTRRSARSTRPRSTAGAQVYSPREGCRRARSRSCRRSFTGCSRGPSAAAGSR
jgi:hypothetical protein